MILRTTRHIRLIELLKKFDQTIRLITILNTSCTFCDFEIVRVNLLFFYRNKMFLNLNQITSISYFPWISACSLGFREIKKSIFNDWYAAREKLLFYCFQLKLMKRIRRLEFKIYRHHVSRRQKYFIFFCFHICACDNSLFQIQWRREAEVCEFLLLDPMSLKKKSSNK